MTRKSGFSLDIYLSRQFLLFLLVGGVAALLHWLARIGFDVWFGYLTSIVLAYFVGLIVAFILNRVFVFPKSNRSMSFEISAFTIVNILAFPVVVAVSYVSSEMLLRHFLSLDLARLIGHGAGVISPVLVNFAAHKFWTFGED